MRKIPIISRLLVLGVFFFVTVSMAQAEPSVPLREVAGKIVVDTPKPISAAKSESVSSPPPASVQKPAARNTPSARPIERVSLDKAPPLKLDPDFASAKRIVPFAFNKVGIGPRGKLAIQELLPLAKRSEKVYVRGRTDGAGKNASNRKVAYDRAYTVYKAFRNGGIKREKLRVTYCSQCFVAHNNTEEGRSQNRRVEVEMIMPRDEVASLPKPVHAPEALPPLAISTSLQTPPR